MFFFLAHTDVLQSSECVLVRTFCGEMVALAKTTSDFASTEFFGT